MLQSKPVKVGVSRRRETLSGDVYAHAVVFAPATCLPGSPSGERIREAKEGGVLLRPLWDSGENNDKRAASGSERPIFPLKVGALCCPPFQMAHTLNTSFGALRSACVSCMGRGMICDSASVVMPTWYE